MRDEREEFQLNPIRGWKGSLPGPVQEGRCQSALRDLLCWLSSAEGADSWINAWASIRRISVELESLQRISCRCLVKRSRALLGSNPTRNSQADGAPKAPGPPLWPRALFAFGRRSHASINPAGTASEASPSSASASARRSHSWINRSPACHRNRNTPGTRPSALRCAACYPYMALAPVHNGLFVTSQAGSR